MTTIKIPIRTVYDNSNTAVGLAEFQTGEVIGISQGGTSANTAAQARINLEVDTANIRGLFGVSGDLSYNSSTGVFSFINDPGDIESVTAGNGLTGGGTSGNVTLDVVGGFGVTVNTNNVEVNKSQINALARTSITVAGAASYDNTTGIINVTGNVSSVAGQVGDISNAQLKSAVLSSTGNIIPETDNVFSLGSASLRFKDLFLGANSLYLGNLVLKDNGETLIITDGSNTIFTAEATAGFTNSTVIVFPGTLGDTDYASGESFVGQSSTSDAFGVSTGIVFDCMEPKGKTEIVDLAALT